MRPTLRDLQQGAARKLWSDRWQSRPGSIESRRDDLVGLTLAANTGLKASDENGLERWGWAQCVASTVAPLTWKERWPPYGRR